MTTALPTELPFKSPGGFVEIGANGTLTATTTIMVEGKTEPQEVRCSATGPLKDPRKRGFGFSYPSIMGSIPFDELPDYDIVLKSVLDDSAAASATLEIGMDVAAKMYAQGILNPAHFTAADYSGNRADLGTVTDSGHWWLRDGRRIVVTDETKAIRIV